MAPFDLFTVVLDACTLFPMPNQGTRTMTTRRKPPKKPESFAAGVGRGMRRAARTAREVARMHGTPVYVWEDGKVVAKKP
jgi:hypothetical protein